MSRKVYSEEEEEEEEKDCSGNGDSEGSPLCFHCNLMYSTRMMTQTAQRLVGTQHAPRYPSLFFLWVSKQQKSCLSQACVCIIVLICN